jgi:cytochrome o ubiquinol oxidase subunit 2
VTDIRGQAPAASPTRKRLARPHILGRLAVGVLAAGLLGGCHRAGILDPQGPIAGAEQLILLNATSIMLVVVAPVILLTLAFAFWYRSSHQAATYDPDWVYSAHLELLVWAVPAMVVILLAGVGWTSSHELDPARKLPAQAEPLQIQVVSLDWKWLFIYPDLGVATVNELFVPSDTPLEFTLTSATVMNAFFVPQLGSQIATMPGMITHLNLLADRAGDYAGLSTQFSGDGFSDMRFVVHALSAGEFKRWQAEAHGKEGAQALTQQSFARLAQPTSEDHATAYGEVEPGFFDAIVQRTAQPLAASHGAH